MEMENNPSFDTEHYTSRLKELFAQLRNCYSVSYDEQKINDIEKVTKIEIQKIFSADNYQVKKSYEKVTEKLSPAKSNLLQLNKFISELELTISEKR